ncbi:MAG: AI-2E family transporter [Gemmataceae bacterium]
MKDLKTWLRFLVIWGSVVLLVLTFYFGRVLLVPLVLAILLTFILTPLVNRLQRAGLGRAVSAIAVVTLVCLLIAGVGTVLIMQVTSLANELPQHKEVIVHKVKDVYDGAEAAYTELFDAVFEIKAKLTPAADSDKTKVIAVKERDYVGLIQTTLGMTAQFLVDLGFVLLLVIFMLIAREDLRNRLIRLSGDKNLTHMTKALDDASSRISSFLLIQLLINCAYGVVLGVGLFLIGVPYALLLGFVAALARYIPYVGAWIAIAFPLLLATAVFPSWWPVLTVFGLFLVLELASANFIEPLLYGHSIGVSNTAIIIMAVFWAWIWGPLGLVLSTPLTACLVVLGRYLPAFAFFDILLGDRPVLPVRLSFFQRLIAHDEDEASDLLEKYLKKHPVERMYDDMLVPTLHLARAAHERGDLSSSDLRYVRRALRAFVEEYGGEEAPTASVGADRAPPLVVGVPVKSEEDQLALAMFRRLLGSRSCRFEVLSHKMLVGELRTLLRKQAPELVVLFNLPPGGRMQTRLLCKRLHADAPNLKIIVTSWHQDGEPEGFRARMENAGAVDSAMLLVELRDKIAPHLSLASAQTNGAVEKPDSSARSGSPAPAGSAS